MTRLRTALGAGCLIAATVGCGDGPPGASALRGRAPASPSTHAIPSPSVSVGVSVLSTGGPESAAPAAAPSGLAPPATGAYAYDTSGRERYGSLSRSLPSRSLYRVKATGRAGRETTLRILDDDGNGFVETRTLRYETARVLLESFVESRSYGGTAIENRFVASGVAVEAAVPSPPGTTWAAEFESTDGCYRLEIRRTVLRTPVEVTVGARTLTADEIRIRAATSTRRATCHPVELESESTVLLWRDNGLIVRQTSHTEGTVGAFPLTTDVSMKLTSVDPTPA